MNEYNLGEIHGILAGEPANMGDVAGIAIIILLLVLSLVNFLTKSKGTKEEEEEKVVEAVEEKAPAVEPEPAAERVHYLATRR